jgi:hypothetical protein
VAALVDTLVRVVMVHQAQLEPQVLAAVVVAVQWVTLVALDEVAAVAAVPVYLVKALMEQQAVQPLLIVD